MSFNISKMPTTVVGGNDRTSSFSIGRKAYRNNTFESDKSNNLPQNLKYTKNNTTSKPIKQNSSDLRTMALRLKTTGSASMSSKTNELKYYSVDINYVNSVLNRTRGGGSVAPKKGKTGI